MNELVNWFFRGLGMNDTSNGFHNINSTNKLFAFVNHTLLMQPIQETFTTINNSLTNLLRNLLFLQYFMI